MKSILLVLSVAVFLSSPIAARSVPEQFPVLSSTAAIGRPQTRPWNVDSQINDAINLTLDLLQEGRLLISKLVELRSQQNKPVLTEISFPPLIESNGVPELVNIPVRSTPDEVPKAPVFFSAVASSTPTPIVIENVL